MKEKRRYLRMLFDFEAVRLVLLIVSGIFILSLPYPLCADEVGPGAAIVYDSDAAYDLGTEDMVTGAGAVTVAKPARTYVQQITVPGVLSQSNTEYVLMNDIVADGTAFTIRGDNITLNLNGHTIFYGNTDGTPAYGVLVDGYQRRNIAILNGAIQQGEGACYGNVYGYLCNPVYAYETFAIEIGGLDITYHSPDTTGIYLHWGGAVGGAHVHHNTIDDQGTVVTNRDQGIDAIKTIALRDSRIHHNLIKRARHVGIRLGNSSEAYNNEMHLDSQDANSYGVMIYGRDTFSVHHNKITGEGIHPIGIGAVAGALNGKVYSNYVEVQNTKWGAEYGDTGSAGFRTTWGADNLEVMYNTFVVKASQDYNGTGVNSWGRALWVGLPDAAQRAEFHDNVIVATNNDGVAKAAGIAVVCLNKSPNLIFRNNKVISNWGNVLLSDSYGYADGYPKFIDNTFVQQDAHAGYRTIRSQNLWYISTGDFIANRFEGGASMDSIELQFSASVKKEIKAGWHLDVVVTDASGMPLSDAAVVVQTNAGAVIFNGSTDGNGSVRADVAQYAHTNVLDGVVVSSEMIINMTPHTVIITKNDVTETITVTVDGNKTLNVVLSLVKGTIKINNDAPYIRTRTVSLNLSCSASGGSTCTQMQFSNDQTTWSTPVAYASTASWTLPAGDGVKTVYAKFSGSPENWSSVVNDTIILDSIRPTTTASPAAGVYNAVSVALTCSDGAGSGCDKIYYTTDGTTPISASPVYAGPIPIVTTTTLKFFAIDLAGNREGVKSKIYTIDTQPPTGTIMINRDAPYTNKRTVTLYLSCADNIKCAQMSFSNNEGATWSSPMTYSATKTWALSPGDGMKTVTAKFKDSAGNWSSVASDMIVLDTSAPVNGFLIAAAGAGQVSLSWSGFSDALSGIAGYKLVYSTGGYPSTRCTTGTPFYLGTETSYAHTGVAAGTTYYYRLCALDNAGNTSTGAIASVRP